MRNLIILISLFSLANIFSSKKDQAAIGISTVEWAVNGVSYSTHSLSRVGNNQMLAAVQDNSGNSLQLFFNAIPTSSGTYKVVNQSKAGNNTLASGEMAVEFNIGNSEVYLSTGTDNISITITVTNGKISLTLPSIVVSHLKTTNGVVTPLSNSSGSVTTFLEG